MNAWIDTYHTVRRLIRQDGWVFLTDSAVGSPEEDNLRHLVTNLGLDVPRAHVVPFLTAKHTLDYCLTYADRAMQHGFPALVVLGGDRTVGPPRCVPHAWQLRQLVHERQPGLVLGGWANPHADAERQVDFLLDPRNTARFYLTQIVSHHQLPAVDRFLDEASRRGLTIPGLFGVFYYRSANPVTLRALGEFLPVPAKGLQEEFGAGATADEVCSRTVSRLWRAGVQHVYISNLPLERAHQTVERVTSLARQRGTGDTAPGQRPPASV